MRIIKLTRAALLAAAPLFLGAPAANAHPHVWVTSEATVLYANGTITGIQQAWTFDEMYTAQAIEGLDKNGDGKYDRQELQELAQVNIDGLKEFDYFTFAKLGNAPLKFKPPVDYWLSYTDKGILTLHFTLPLEKPVPADAAGFNFAVYDASFFIAFDLAPNDPVKLGAGAPAGCKAAIHDPENDDNDTQRLNEAFSAAMGGGAGNGGPMSGAKQGAGGTGSAPGATSSNPYLSGMGKSVAIQCAKS